MSYVFVCRHCFFTMFILTFVLEFRVSHVCVLWRSNREKRNVCLVALKFGGAHCNVWGDGGYACSFVDVSGDCCRGCDAFEQLVDDDVCGVWMGCGVWCVQGPPPFVSPVHCWWLCVAVCVHVVGGR